MLDWFCATVVKKFTRQNSNVTSALHNNRSVMHKHWCLIRQSQWQVMVAKSWFEKFCTINVLYSFNASVILSNQELWIFLYHRLHTIIRNGMALNHWCHYYLGILLSVHCVDWSTAYSTFLTVCTCNCEIMHTVEEELSTTHNTKSFSHFLPDSKILHHVPLSILAVLEGTQKCFQELWTFPVEPGPFFTFWSVAVLMV